MKIISVVRLPGISLFQDAPVLSHATLNNYRRGAGDMKDDKAIRNEIDFIDEKTAILSIDSELCESYSKGNLSETDLVELDRLMDNLLMVLRGLAKVKLH